MKQVMHHHGFIYLYYIQVFPNNFDLSITRYLLEKFFFSIKNKNSQNYTVGRYQKMEQNKSRSLADRPKATKTEDNFISHQLA